MDLFQVKGTKLSPLKTVVPTLEREIQRLLEANLEAVFGMRLVASEYATGQKHAGRIDTLGLDENNTPVIIEYKLKSSVNIVVQALFYLDWLLDHKGDFEILVHKRLGSEVPVDWTSPRVLCVADSFAYYDVQAVGQMKGNIQLVEYKRFESEVLAISLLGGGERGRTGAKPGPSPSTLATYSVERHLSRGTPPIREIAERLRQYLLDLGEDVSEGPVQDYIAYRTTRNVCCLEVHKEHVLLYLTLDPSLGEGCPLCRDVTSIGHYGTGNLEVRVRVVEDIPPAERLIDLAYKELSHPVSA